PGPASAADGRLSIVDPKTRTEVAVLNGLGESPGAAAFHPTGGRLLIASALEGILEVNTSIRAVTRGPSNGIKPEGDGVSGLAIDLRDRGWQSPLAKGALRPKSRFGAGLELLSEGTAQLYFRETRELHTLGAFDLVNLRRELAADVGRFAGATALTEVMLKMAPPAPLPVAYDTLTSALDALEQVPPGQIDAAAVRALWSLLAVLGFEPSLARCARDGSAIEPATDEPVLFSVADGGALCPRCGPTSAQPPSRLPPRAFADLV